LQQLFFPSGNYAPAYFPWVTPLPPYAFTPSHPIR
jgi:hypothetical protein